MCARPSARLGAPRQAVQSTARSAARSGSRSAGPHPERPEVPPAWTPGQAINLYWPLHLRRRVERAAGLIEAAGGELYLVGGALRDRALGRWPVDYDLCVVGLEFAQLAPLLREAGLRSKAGRSHPVLRVTAGATQGALLEWTVLSQAEWQGPLGQRSDFTVNTLALRLLPRGHGRLFSTPQARADLQAACLRVLDDRTELMRALRSVRLCATLGFEPSAETRAMWRDPELESLMLTSDVTATQRGQELTRALQGPYPDVLAAAHAAGLLALWLGVELERGPAPSLLGPPGAQRLFSLFAGSPQPALEASRALCDLALPSAVQRPLMEALRTPEAARPGAGLAARVCRPGAGAAQHQAQLRRLGLN